MHRSCNNCAGWHGVRNAIGVTTRPLLVAYCRYGDTYNAKVVVPNAVPQIKVTLRDIQALVTRRTLISGRATIQEASGAAGNVASAEVQAAEPECAMETPRAAEHDIQGRNELPVLRQPAPEHPSLSHSRQRLRREVRSEYQIDIPECLLGCAMNCFQTEMKPLLRIGPERNIVYGAAPL